MGASKAQRAATAKRRADAIAMRMAGHTYDQIAEALGYSAKAAAYVDISRALEANLSEQRRTVELHRQEELESLDVLLAQAWEVLRREHVTVSHGKIIVDEDGNKLLDDAPVLQAIDRILKIRERRAKLLGLDAPTKVEAITIDALDAEIARLSAELDGEQPSTVPVE